MAKKRSLVIEILGNNKMGRAVRDAMGSLRRLGRFAQSVGRSIRSAFKVGLAGVVAFTGGLAVALRQSAQFNIQMARAWTMANGGMKTFKTMREEVMQLSSELGVAREQLASGLYQALSAGVPQDNVFSFLRIAAKTAIADGSEIEVAVDGITTLLNSFKVEASKTGEVVDLMFSVVRGGKTTFADLASNLAKSAPVAAALGVGMDQILAAVAALTKQGTPTEVALTSLRNIMLSLNKEFGDGWAESMTLQDALEKVAKEAKYSATALEGIFSKRDVAQVLGLTGKNAATAASSLDDMTKSAGALTEAYTKVQQFRFWERLKQTLLVVATRFGIAVEEGAELSGIIDQIAGAADKLGKDYAAKLLPYIQEIRSAVDMMLSPDPKQVEAGKAAIASMFDRAGDVIKPKFEEWGEAAGAAIWRGFKRGGGKVGEKVGGATGRILEGRAASIATLGASNVLSKQIRGAGALAGAYRPEGGGFGGRLSAGMRAVKSEFGLGTDANPVCVKEVQPIDGVKGE